MKSLLKALVFAAAATGAAYVAIYLLDPPGATGRDHDPSRDALDEDDLTRAEKEALLRELDSYL